MWYTNELSGIFATLSLLFDAKSRIYSIRVLSHPPPAANASDECRRGKKYLQKNSLHAQNTILDFWLRVCVCVRGVCGVGPCACVVVSTVRLCHDRNHQHFGLFNSLICVFCCCFLFCFSHGAYRARVCVCACYTYWHRTWHCLVRVEWLSEHLRFIDENSYFAAVFVLCVCAWVWKNSAKYIYIRIDASSCRANSSRCWMLDAGYWNAMVATCSMLATTEPISFLPNLYLNVHFGAVGMRETRKSISLKHIDAFCLVRFRSAHASTCSSFSVISTRFSFILFFFSCLPPPPSLATPNTLDFSWWRLPLHEWLVRSTSPALYWEHCKPSLGLFFFFVFSIFILRVLAALDIRLQNKC